MTLTFENEQDFDLGFDPEEVAAAVINGVLDQEACPYEAEVELILTDPENIRTMNREHRNIDRETDVLSFPMVDYPSPASFDFLETEEGDDCFNPDSGELMLGDIVISVARARAQAEEYGHSLRREFAFLVAHSMLHLLGYDHMTPEEGSRDGGKAGRGAAASRYHKRLIESRKGGVFIKKRGFYTLGIALLGSMMLFGCRKIGETAPETASGRNFLCLRRDSRGKQDRNESYGTTGPDRRSGTGAAGSGSD